jgi:hypothetical protein
VTPYAAQTIAEIAVGWVGKNQQEITGKRTGEEEEGWYGIWNTEFRIQELECRSQNQGKSVAETESPQY